MQYVWNLTKHYVPKNGGKMDFSENVIKTCTTISTDLIG
jgi:hypothetical protein